MPKDKISLAEYLRITNNLQIKRGFEIKKKVNKNDRGR